MATKKLSEVTKVTTIGTNTYVPLLLSDGSIGQILKDDLANALSSAMDVSSLNYLTGHGRIPFRMYSRGSTSSGRYKKIGRISTTDTANGYDQCCTIMLFGGNNFVTTVSQYILSVIKYRTSMVSKLTALANNSNPDLEVKYGYVKGKDYIDLWIHAHTYCHEIYALLFNASNFTFETVIQVDEPDGWIEFSVS